MNISTNEGVKVKFHHFPGHTPGCSMIEINRTFFSGDFIFKGTIGRFDFPNSSSTQMKKSLNKILGILEGKVFITMVLKKQ